MYCGTVVRIILVVLTISSGLIAYPQSTAPTFVIAGTVIDKTETAQGGRLRVKVDTSKQTPKSIGDLSSQEVEILTDHPSQYKKNGRYTFSAVGDSAGDILTLREVRTRPAIHPLGLSASVSDRIAKSDAVVQGTILNIIPNTPEVAASGSEHLPIRPPSEHRSQVKTVQLQITKVLSGSIEKSVVSVQVETSQDVAHISGDTEETGQIKVGASDIFALRRDPTTSTWTATVPTDVQPTFQMNSVKEVLALQPAAEKRKPQ